MRRRRAILILALGTVILALLAGAMPKMIQESIGEAHTAGNSRPVEAQAVGLAAEALEKLQVKGRAPKTGYERSRFGDGWVTVQGCTTRNIILYRDLRDAVLDDSCRVLSGTLEDPYTGQTIAFSNDDASKVQIDHVVALSDAWQKGAQQLSQKTRERLANDPLELLAVDGPQNQAKSDGDAATWLPKNKSFRCEYVARQIAIKQKYELWVTISEKEAMLSVLRTCPGQILP